MDIEVKQAYSYWQLLRTNELAQRLKIKGIFTDEMVETLFKNCKADLGLEESLQQLMDKSYLERITKIYGRDLDSTPIPYLKAVAKTKRAANIDPAYRSFSEIVIKSDIHISSSYALQGWLQSRNTVGFLSLWEQSRNPFFHLEAANRLMEEAESTNTTLTIKKWSAQTGAIGIVSLPGRYGGTYAHDIIAMDFTAWLSPKERFRLFAGITARGSV